MATKTDSTATEATPAPTLLTVTVMPAKNGKRKIIVSGAPAGEMPIVRTGLFADRHVLLDEVWGELQHRKPQVVKAKGQTKKDKAPNEQAQAVAAEVLEGESANPASAEQLAQLDTRAQHALGAGSKPLTPPADLPVIEETATPQLTLNLE
jgi:hypothetical protein